MEGLRETPSEAVSGVNDGDGDKEDGVDIMKMMMLAFARRVEVAWSTRAHYTLYSRVCRVCISRWEKTPTP